MIAVRIWTVTSLTAMVPACGSMQAPAPDPAPATTLPETASAAPVAAADNDRLVGVIDELAPPFEVTQWFNSAPLTLEQLRGKVVFVRWFMGPSCPFCSATAPTLRALHERHAAKGLAVIGMYHHKEATPLDPTQVAGWVKHYGYQFPVAIDQGWATLRRWWLDGHERSFTSVSFLLDKRGIVRRVHLGGTIEPAGDAIAAITADVERLLAE
ncbi:MAG: TlpA family protein disulfide reductase [Myxococcota bacterium]|nr:TlpA family protein disulfide reductase [Myxococcota bacterium]